MRFNLIHKHDWLITILIFFLVSSGTLIIFSTTYNSEINTEGAGTVPKQLFFIIFGMVVYFGISILDIDWLKQRTIQAIIYFITISLLVYLKLFGDVIAETQRWIQIGFINIQPSEVAKLTVILFTAYIWSLDLDDITIFNKFREKIPKFLESVFYNQIFSKTFFTLILLSPIVVLIFLQPALGNALIVFFLWFVLVLLQLPNQLKILNLIAIGITLTVLLYNLVRIDFLGLNFLDRSLILYVAFIFSFILGIFITKVDLRIMLATIVIALISIPTLSFVWNNVLQDYHRERINTYLEGPESDRYGSGYQVIQSLIAVGSGRLEGRGFFQGPQSSLRVLDYAHTDFIFASLGEQFGFIGNSFIMIIYLVLILRCINIGAGTNDVFLKIISYGVSLMILLNMLINMGMNMALLPVTGVPLPLVSYGGTSVLINLIGLGLVQSVKSNTQSIDMSGKLLVVS